MDSCNDQRGSPVLCSCVDIGTCIYHRDCRLKLVELARDHQGAPTVLVFEIWIRFFFQKTFNIVVRVVMDCVRRFHQSGLSKLCCIVGVCPVLQEHIRDLSVASAHCVHQRCLSEIIFCIDSRLSTDEFFHTIFVHALRCENQSSVAVPIFAFKIGLVGDEQAYLVEFALLCCLAKSLAGRMELVPFSFPNKRHLEAGACSYCYDKAEEMRAQLGKAAAKVQQC
mmetsp:Transcript_28446/g.50081  ORF Transcript_28446/g.50081 Transcript_28446/m.50081 type:complete len:224 (-) Transcript_28446:165-836(-)